MLKIRELNFEKKYTNRYECSLISGLAFSITNICDVYWAELFDERERRILFTISNCKSYKQAKRTCRQFLKDLFENVIEVERKV